MGEGGVGRWVGVAPAAGRPRAGWGASSGGGRPPWLLAALPSPAGQSPTAPMPLGAPLCTHFTACPLSAPTPPHCPRPTRVLSPKLLRVPLPMQVPPQAVLPDVHYRVNRTATVAAAVTAVAALQRRLHCLFVVLIAFKLIQHLAAVGWHWGGGMGGQGGVLEEAKLKGGSRAVQRWLTHSACSGGTVGSQPGAGTGPAPCCAPASNHKMWDNSRHAAASPLPSICNAHPPTHPPPAPVAAGRTGPRPAPESLLWT